MAKTNPPSRSRSAKQSTSSRRAPAQQSKKQPAAKKTPARKAPAKKTPAKKAPAKGTGPKRRPSSGGPRTEQRRRSILWRTRRGLFLAGLLFMASIAGAGYVLGRVEIPPEDPLLQSTFICGSDVVSDCNADNSIAKLAGEVDRVSVPLDEIPKVFIDAVLAAEDRQFFSHGGIDPVGITRAVYQAARNQGVQQGGSTITQQYVKNAFLTSERTVTRKLKEAVLAVKLERELEKTQILQRYLNTVYFGRGAYGAEAAARAYYGVSIRDVDLAQSAYLAALIRAPESADATRDPEIATFRRNSVLAGMLEMAVITPAQRDAAAAVDVESSVSTRRVREGLGDVTGAEYGSEYYVEYVRRLLYDRYGADVVNGGGLRVYTTLDQDLQRQAYDAVYGTLDRDDDPAGALVSVDTVGRVVALVGGKDFAASEVNLALGAAAGGSGRQAGSSFKPIVLAAAIEDGYSVRSKYLNENSITLPRANAGEDWKVSNYADGEEDVVDLVEATRVSSNTAYARLMLEVGPSRVVDLAHDLGVESDIPAVNSLVLGSGDVSVLDMAAAYSTFSRRGKHVEPIFITKVEQVIDGEVRVLDEERGGGDQVIEQSTADMVNFVLRQVILEGTGTSANFGTVAAGKTGTTQNFRDAWFVGYTPRLTTAVWMGFPDLDENGETKFMRGVRGRNVTGGSFPAEIWRSFMQAATSGIDQGAFVPPSSFPGEILNPDLTTTTTTTTTTTRPLCEPVTGGGDDDDEDDGESSATTAPCRTTTTTTTEPDTSSSSTSSSSTTTPSSSSSTSSTTSTSTPSSSSSTSTPSSSSTSSIPDIGD